MATGGRTKEEQDLADHEACAAVEVLCREALRVTRNQPRARQFLNEAMTFYNRLLRVVIDGHLRDHVKPGS